MIQLFFVDFGGADGTRASHLARSARRGSAIGVSLLAYAVRRVFGVELPKITADEHGKPFFSQVQDMHFSVSHSGEIALCAVSDLPVGCDVERRREMKPSHIARIVSPEELAAFDFFELWTLRESFFKLHGTGLLLDARFTMSGGEIIAPYADVHCRLFDEIPGYAAAVCSYGAELPSGVIQVPIETVFNTQASQCLS